MNCPSCRKPMIVLEIESVEVDHCTTCGGLWLDRGELEILLEGSRNRDALLSSFSRDDAGRARGIRCPICLRKLEPVRCGAERVQLDKCPRSDGFWFDAGELEKILKMGEFPPSRRVYELVRDTFGKKRA